jgi:hypothetical protein
LYHDQFGEGFDTEVEEITASYASYFVEVLGIKMHIGYDHRGTQIETEYCMPVKLFTVLKKLADQYIEASYVSR